MAAAANTQSTDPPINTDAGILDFLARTSTLQCVSAERLSGGAVNHVWRISLASDDADDNPAPAPHARRTVIAKHAEPFVRLNPRVPFPTVRMDFEARALALAPALLADADADADSESPYGIRTPRVIEYSSAAHVLVLDDGGRRTLKDTYPALSTAQVQSIGMRLAKWIARLHMRSADTDIGPGGNGTAKSIYRYMYQNLQGTFKKYGLGGPKGELGRVVDEKFGALLESDDECVAHGDFWPGNMIVDDAAAVDDQVARNAEGSDVEADVGLTIIDWEMTRRGVGVTDVAQFAAEAYLLDRFRDVNHKLAATFLKSYVSDVPPSRKFWTRFAIHWATHLSFWSWPMGWGSIDETKKVAALGIKVIEMAMDDSDVLEDYLRERIENATETL